MPTSTSDPSRRPHQERTVAESFGSDAERYDRARPAYPDDLIGRILSTAPGRDVLDVGCGTGIQARQLQAIGGRVLGVEPDARMAAHARSLGLEIEEATFEDWDSAARRFDAVIAAQAWHWVDPTAGAAKVKTVLRPGGLFAAFWHVFDAPEPIGAALVEAVREVVPDLPFDPAALLQADKAYEKGAVTTGERFDEVGGFGEPELWRFPWKRHYTREEWLDFVPTQGFLTRLTDRQRAPILDAVGDAIDDLGGSFVLNTVTVGVAVRRD